MRQTKVWDVECRDEHWKHRKEICPGHNCIEMVTFFFLCPWLHCVMEDERYQAQFSANTDGNDVWFLSWAYIHCQNIDQSLGENQQYFCIVQSCRFQCASCWHCGATISTAIISRPPSLRHASPCEMCYEAPAHTSQLSCLMYNEPLNNTVGRVWFHFLLNAGSAAMSTPGRHPPLLAKENPLPYGAFCFIVKRTYY